MGFDIKQINGSWSLESRRTHKDVFRLEDTGHPVFTFPPDRATLFDDFLGDVLADQWSGAAGTDTAGAAPAINAQENGVVRLTSGDAGGGNDAADGSVLTAGLNWYAENGGLVIEGRIKLVSAITTVNVCFGFTDVLGTTAVEAPFEIGSTDAITSNATDAVCFVFDTAGTDDQWAGLGVKNGTDTSRVDTGLAPTADTYQRLRIEVGTAGDATFFVDGVEVGSVANAVTATVALTPVLFVMTRTTATRSVDADYIFCQQER